ncbi:hypothetical protein RchiOBHm_Chr4g0418511 [Rosa chinensis]|uniref:Uncharacterized protein n=1 Tax=Rosa chinensis TaxID=74649 RepID=A0A2P6QXL3_ROSCH|nr:hypothetical protein RchiOBHm_Chr4g0418511 [Rosa chinensis]
MGANESRKSSGQGENGGAPSGNPWFIAGLAAVALGAAKLVLDSASSEKQRKTMKAPGGNERIYRDDFERDPKQYFQDKRARK